jgi:hypothetical protein
MNSFLHLMQIIERRGIKRIGCKIIDKSHHRPARLRQREQNVGKTSNPKLKDVSDGVW